MFIKYIAAGSSCIAMTSWGSAAGPRTGFGESSSARSCVEGSIVVGDDTIWLGLAVLLETPAGGTGFAGLTSRFAAATGLAAGRSGRSLTSFVATMAPVAARGAEAPMFALGATGFVGERSSRVGLAPVLLDQSVADSIVVGVSFTKLFLRAVEVSSGYWPSCSLLSEIGASRSSFAPPWDGRRDPPLFCFVGMV